MVQQWQRHFAEKAKQSQREPAAHIFGVEWAPNGSFHNELASVSKPSIRSADWIFWVEVYKDMKIVR